VPMSLVAAISDRLGFLSEDTLSMLRAAALLGTEFTVTDLGVLIDRPATELAPAVEEALRAGVLADAGSRLAFRHAVIRQVLYDATPAALRVALHQEAARSLAEAAAPADHVARQLLAALPDGGAAGADGGAHLDDWALDWLTGPGSTVVLRTPQVATELLGRAVGQVRDDDPRREDLQATFASVLMLTGHREEAARLAEAVRTGTADPARAAEVTWTLVWARLGQMSFVEAVRVLDEVVAAGSDDVWSARLRALRPFAARVAGHRGLEGSATAALAEALASGDELSIAVSAVAVHAFRRGRGDFEGGLEIIEQCLPLIGTDPRFADSRLLMMNDRMFALDALDRLAEADVVARDLLSSAAQYASPMRRSFVHARVVQHYWTAGRWDEAAALLETIAEDALALPTVFRSLQPGVAALIAAHRDDAATAQAHLDSMADAPVHGEVAASSSQYLTLARAVLAERAGDLARARDVLAGTEDARAFARFSHPWLWLPWLVRLAVATGELDLAWEAAAAVTGSGRSQVAAAAHCRGLLEGDPEALLAAADGFGGVGRTAERAAALEDAAVALGARRDGAGARTAYAQALEIYSGLGAEWDLRRAHARVRPFDLRRRRTRRPATGWDALTPTELTVAALVAEGHSNPDIAARLVLSRRTVDVHVSHILAKLGVRSRVDIAREAFKHPAPTRSA
ncbi:MAG TPA: LuxR C-terminal-related transcriptional regulator, partial [Mycobacteriales bacterium]